MQRPPCQLRLKLARYVLSQQLDRGVTVHQLHRRTRQHQFKNTLRGLVMKTDELRLATGGGQRTQLQLGQRRNIVG